MLPTAYTRTHVPRQQQQRVMVFAFSMIVMVADILAAASHAGVKQVRPIAV